MKLKDDPWLTDYVNAIHFTVRVLEKRGRYRQALSVLKAQTSALIREAILANVPMEIFSMQRIAQRVRDAESGIYYLTDGRQPASLTSYQGDTYGLLSDYTFVRDGFAEFGLRDIIHECRLYFEKLYPEISDIDAVITELFQQDIQDGRIREIKPGLYGHAFR
jgi:hypothetical protein